MTIPDLVKAQLALHVAETMMKREQVIARLDGLRLTTSESRRLRAQRDRLSAELDAWCYLEGEAHSVGMPPEAAQ